MWVKATSGKYVNLSKADCIDVKDPTSTDNSLPSAYWWVVASFGDIEEYIADFESATQAHVSLDKLFETWRGCSESLFMVPEGILWTVPKRERRAPR